MKASNFVSDFSPAEFSLFSLPARVGGPGFTFIRDKRDNPLESTKGQYFTLDAFASSSYFGSQADYGRGLAQDSTYYAFGRPNHKFVIARSTTLGLEQVYHGTVVLPPGACEVVIWSAHAPRIFPSSRCPKFFLPAAATPIAGLG